MPDVAGRRDPIATSPAWSGEAVRGKEGCSIFFLDLRLLLLQFLYFLYGRDLYGSVFPDLCPEILGKRMCQADAGEGWKIYAVDTDGFGLDLTYGAARFAELCEGEGDCDGGRGDKSCGLSILFLGTAEENAASAI